MNPEPSWTKEMIDEIKDCEIDNCFPIIIKIQDNYCEFSDKVYDYDEEYNFTATSPISYEGIFSSSHCDDDLDGDYDAEKYKLWERVYIKIHFYDHETRKFEELSSEIYKYGYLKFMNKGNNGSKPALIIGLNKECGIKETIDDLFIKSKIFNHKNLDMDIYYDCEFVKDIEYKDFFYEEHHINLVPIKSIILNVRFGLDKRPYVIVKE